jgi:hypothetical protein
MASVPKSISDIPDEILLEILSRLGPEDILFNFANVCKRWNSLTKEVILWKSLSYVCDPSSNISRIKEVGCTTLLWFSTN